MTGESPYLEDERRRKSKRGLSSWQKKTKNPFLNPRPGGAKAVNINTGRGK